MAKAGLIVLGIILIIITIYATQVMITPSQKSDIKTIDSLCTSELNVWGINFAVGSWGQKILNAEEECNQAHSMMIIINYGWVGYLLGGFFLILGLSLGGTHVEKESKRKRSGRFCGECGNELDGHEKHCPECGAKI